MNEAHHFSLTDNQKILYRTQPDHLIGFKWTNEGDYEISQYMYGTSLRFWYNIEALDYHTHWHEAVEMVIPLENSYEVIIQEQPYVLKPGDILIIPPGFLHTMKAPASGARFVFLYEMDFLSSLQGFSYITTLLNEPILINNSLCREIYTDEISLIMQSARHYWSNSISKELRIYSCLMEFFSIYADYYTYKNTRLNNQTSPESRSLTAKLTVAFDYLEHHFQENITLDTVAEASNFSKFHFSRIFKECTGKTFHEYLTGRRLKAAEQLLLDPTLSIIDIALQCGFSTHSTFSRTFKQNKGYTPSEFRHFHMEPLSSGPM